MVLWSFEILLLMTVGVRHTSPAHVYISVSMYINNTFLSFSRMISLEWTLLYAKMSLYWVLVLMEGLHYLRLYLSIKVWSQRMYTGMRLKRALNAWKAIACVWVSYCVRWVCVDNYYSVCVRLCLHAGGKQIASVGVHSAPLREPRLWCTV